MAKPRNICTCIYPESIKLEVFVTTEKWKYQNDKNGLYKNLLQFLQFISLRWNEQKTLHHNEDVVMFSHAFILRYNRYIRSEHNEKRNVLTSYPSWKRRFQTFLTMSKLQRLQILSHFDCPWTGRSGNAMFSKRITQSQAHTSNHKNGDFAMSLQRVISSQPNRSKMKYIQDFINWRPRVFTTSIFFHFSSFQECGVFMVYHSKTKHPPTFSIRRWNVFRI